MSGPNEQSALSQQKQETPIQTAPQQIQDEVAIQPAPVQEQAQDAPATVLTPIQQELRELSEEDRHILAQIETSITADLQKPVREGVFTTRLQEKPTGWASHSVLGKSARKAASRALEERTQALLRRQAYRNNPDTGQDWAKKTFFEGESSYLSTRRIQNHNNQVRNLQQDEPYLAQTYQRADPIGYEWRSHCQKYKTLKAEKITEHLRSMAEHDVRNLVDNYRLDLFLEQKAEIPQELTHRLSYYESIFRNEGFDLALDSLKASRELQEATEAYCRKHNLTAEQADELKKVHIRQFNDNIGKLLIYPKSIAQNFAPLLVSQNHILHANILALQTVKKMPAGTYRDMMVAMLETQVKQAYIQLQQKLEAFRSPLNAADPAYEPALIKAMDNIATTRRLERTAQGSRIQTGANRQDFLHLYYDNAVQFGIYNLGDQAAAVQEIILDAIERRQNNQNAQMQPPNQTPG